MIVTQTYKQTTVCLYLLIALEATERILKQQDVMCFISLFHFVVLFNTHCVQFPFLPLTILYNLLLLSSRYLEVFVAK